MRARPIPAVSVLIAWRQLVQRRLYGPNMANTSWVIVSFGEAVAKTLVILIVTGHARFGGLHRLTF